MAAPLARGQPVRHYGHNMVDRGRERETIGHPIGLAACTQQSPVGHPLDHRAR
jgi:hypothetical protein